MLNINSLVEVSATEISKVENHDGFHANKKVAIEGAEIARGAKEQLEDRNCVKKNDSFIVLRMILKVLSFGEDLGEGEYLRIYEMSTTRFWANMISPYENLILYR